MLDCHHFVTFTASLGPLCHLRERGSTAWEPYDGAGRDKVPGSMIPCYFLLFCILHCLIIHNVFTNAGNEGACIIKSVYSFTEHMHIWFPFHVHP
jgi:hypothetical protein